MNYVNTGKKILFKSLNVIFPVYFSMWYSFLLVLLLSITFISLCLILLWIWWCIYSWTIICNRKGDLLLKCSICKTLFTTKFVWMASLAKLSVNNDLVNTCKLWFTVFSQRFITIDCHLALTFWSPLVWSASSSFTMNISDNVVFWVLGQRTSSALKSNFNASILAI